MGNTPCVSPNSEVHPHGEHGVTYYVQSDLPQDNNNQHNNNNTHLQQKKHDTASKSPNSALFQFSTSDLLDGSFYALHLEDRPEKCILDAKQIVTCLVQQAEALVQRELASEQQQEQQQEHITASNTHRHRPHNNTSSIPSDEDNEDDDDNSIQESEEEEDSFEETESFSYHSTYRKPRHMRIPEECDEPYDDDGNGHPHNPRPHHSQHYPYDESTTRPLSPSNASSTAASSIWSVVTGGDVSTSLSAATPIHANVVSPQHHHQHRRRRRGRTRGAQSSSSSKNKFLSRSSKSKMAPPRLLGKDVDLDNTLHQDLVKVIDAITQEEEAAAASAHPKGLVAGCLTTTSSLRATRSSVPRQAKMHMITLHLRMRARCARYVPSHILQILPTHPFVEEDISQSANANQHHPHRFQSTKHKHANNSMNWGIDEDHDPMIGEGPPSQAIRLLVDDETPFLDLGITGSLGLVDRPRRRGLPEHYTVLLNRRSGAPLAVCALKQSPFSSEADPVVRIYATKRRAYGQRPAASTRKLGLDWCGDASFPLYPWAEIVSEGRYPHRVQYSIYMATGNDGRFDESPSYLAEHSPRNATEIRIVGKTERESQYSGCATLCLSRQDANMDIMGQDDLFFRLSVVKGVDPALFLCFAAFVDESMEKTMRIQVSAERNYGIKSISV